MFEDLTNCTLREGRRKGTPPPSFLQFARLFRGLAHPRTWDARRKFAASRAYDENSGTGDRGSLGCLELSKTRLGKAHPRKLILLRVSRGERKVYEVAARATVHFVGCDVSRRLPIARKKRRIYTDPACCAPPSPPSLLPSSFPLFLLLTVFY